MKTKILMSVLAIGLAIALIGGATMAWFTDDAEVEPAEFTAGTVIVNADGPEYFPAEGKFFDNVNPGDCGRVKWTIINDGTKAVELRVKLEEEWEEGLNTGNFFYAPVSSDWVMYEDEDVIWLYYIGGPVAGTYGLGEDEDPESVELELVVYFDGELTGNEYQGLGFTLGGNVYAIQASNDAPSKVWGEAWDTVKGEGYVPSELVAEYLERVMGTSCWGGEQEPGDEDPPIVEGERVDAEIIYSGSMSGSKSPAGSLNLTFSPVRIENAKDGNGNLLNGEYNLVLWLAGFEGDSGQYGYSLSLYFTNGNTDNFVVSGWYLFGSGSYHVPDDLYLTFGAN